MIGCVRTQIKLFLKGENTTSVADLGCGLGNYTNEINNAKDLTAIRQPLF